MARTTSSPVAQPAPARRRAPVTGIAGKPEVSLDIMRLARDFYTNNKAANAAKSAAEKARKALLTAMQEAGLKDADIDLLTESGDMLPLRAYIDTPTTESISVEALRKHVSEEVFMKCVSATKKAVTEHAGSALATTCARPGVGTTNVHVEVRK